MFNALLKCLPCLLVETFEASVTYIQKHASSMTNYGCRTCVILFFSWNTHLKKKIDCSATKVFILLTLIIMARKFYHFIQVWILQNIFYFSIVEMISSIKLWTQEMWFSKDLLPMTLTVLNVGLSSVFSPPANKVVFSRVYLSTEGEVP